MVVRTFVVANIQYQQRGRTVYLQIREELKKKSQINNVLIQDNNNIITNLLKHHSSFNLIVHMHGCTGS